MAHLIDKDAVVAEIEKELNTTKKYSTEYVNGKKYALKKIVSFINTLEVKEVDLDEEVDKNDYRKLFEDSAKLNIDSTTEIKFDESTTFK